jgi:hypothetical protein
VTPSQFNPYTQKTAHAGGVDLSPKESVEALAKHLKAKRV